MITKEKADAFRDTLLKGGYNLLLGSGVSLDSHNGAGSQLRSAEKLREELCLLKKLNPKTSLSRVAGLLSLGERQVELVEGFSSCKPGPSMVHLPRFLWKRLFTFNIDDVLENLYKNSSYAKQTLVPVNFDSPFEPASDIRELHAIHLHGWVGSPDTAFVFSHAEYVRVLRGLNPWMHMLAQILPTEPFIIAGTSLNEVDLEYYLSHRNESTPRKDRGPSILIEPNPDPATEADCLKYGLTLIKATFEEFLRWVNDSYPSPPTLSELIIPDIGTLFPAALGSDLPPSAGPKVR